MGTVSLIGLLIPAGLYSVDCHEQGFHREVTQQAGRRRSIRVGQEMRRPGRRHRVRCEARPDGGA